MSILEAIADFLIKIATELREASPLVQTLAIVSIIGALPAIIGVSVWLVRRISVRNITLARLRIQNLEEQLRIQGQELGLRSGEVLDLTKRIQDESPRAWLEVARKERGPQNDNQLLALSALEHGFDLVRDDLRAAMFDLAFHFYSVSSICDVEALMKAWYFSGVAAAIRNDDDVRFIRDGLREIDAEIERVAGSYNPADARWSRFELMPGAGPAASDTKPLLKKMADGVVANLRTGDFATALRLITRAGYIARLRLDANDRLRLSLEHLGTQVLFTCGQYDAALKLATELVNDTHRALGPHDKLTLAARHLLAASQLKMGRLDEAKKEARALVELLERKLGADDPLTLGTRSIAEARETSGPAATIFATGEKAFFWRDEK